MKIKKNLSNFSTSFVTPGWAVGCPEGEADAIGQNGAVCGTDSRGGGEGEDDWDRSGTQRPLPKNGNKRCAFNLWGPWAVISGADMPMTKSWAVPHTARHSQTRTKTRSAGERKRAIAWERGGGVDLGGCRVCIGCFL